MKRISITEINRLALPALVSGVIEPLISLTDTIMAGHIALNTKEVLGAVGIVSSFLTSLVWIFIQSSRAITSQVAYAYGQEKLNQLKSLVAQILTLSLGLSLLCSIFAFFNSEVILTNFYDADGILLDYCLDYFRIRVWGFPFTLLTLTIHSIFRGMQNTSWSMYISILGGVINLVFNYIFVFVLHWDIKGLAWASLLAQGVMFAVSLYFLYERTPYRFILTKSLDPKFFQSLRMSFDLIIRSSLLQGVLYFSFLSATKLGGGEDSTIVATHTILNQVWLFSVFLFDGYCNAGGLLSGRLYSTQQYQTIRDLVKDLFYIVLTIGMAILLVYFLFYHQIGIFMTKNKDVQLLFFETFWIVVLMQPLNAITFLFDGIYKGMGFTAILRNAFIIATFLGFFPTFYVTQSLLEWGLSGIWLTFFVWMAFRGGILIIHYINFFFNRPLQAG